jgi:PAS domain S-box-containing protein
LDLNRDLENEIIERKVIENALKESEERLNALFENMHSGVAIYKSTDGQEFFFSGFNHTAEVIEKLNREALLGKKITEVFPSVRETGLLEVFQRVWQTGVAEHFPSVFYQDERISGWRENYVYKLPNGEIVAIYEDATERKQIEESLRHSEAQFKQLLKMLPIPLCYLGDDGRIEYMNDRFQQVFGYDYDDLPTIEQWWQLAYPDPDYRRWVIDVWEHEVQAAVAENRDVRPLEYNVTCKNGDVRVMAISGITLGDEFLATFIDLTERKRNEERAKLSQIYGGIGTWEADLRTNKQNWSEESYKLFDIPELSQPTWNDFLAMVYPEDRKKVMTATQAHIENGTPYDVEYRVVTPKNSLRWLRSAGRAERNSNGEAIYMRGIVHDITQRKEAELALQQSEAHLRAIIENEPECIKILDAQGRLKQMNPAGLAMLEADSLQQIVGLPALNLIAPEYRAAFADLHKRVIAGETMQLQYEVLGLKGRRRWLETHAVPMQDHNQVVHLAVTRDITERKQTEQQLRELNRDFVTFLENTSDFIYFKDQDSRIRFCSQTLAHITQHKSWRDLIGKHDFEIFPPDTAQVYYQEELPVFNQGQPIINKVNLYYNDDGSKGWVSTSKWPVFDLDNRNVIGIFGISRDITQLKNIEQSLQESELMLKEAQEIAHLGHWILDVPKNKLYWSDEIYRIFGALPQEFSATYQAFLEYVHPEDRPFVEQSYASHLANQSKYEIEHRIVLKDGSTKYVSEKCKTEFNQNGEPSRSVGVVFDITERKHAEKLLQEKTEALQRSNADLERFAYSVSHDMRQPLRAVSGHLQLLQRALKDKLDEENQENLNFALEGAKRMDAMILSLLEYSRVGRKTEMKTWLKSETTLAEALEFLTPAIHEAGVEVKITGEWPQLFASRDELTRLWMNLIGNALKYREITQPPLVEIVSQVAEQNWHVSVKDYGIGINPEHTDRLFQFFSRLQSRARFEGTGMGLALCRRIIEHHGGRIWVESEGEGKGCCFMFEIPIFENQG